MKEIKQKDGNCKDIIFKELLFMQEEYFYKNYKSQYIPKMINNIKKVWKENYKYIAEL